MIDDIIRPYPGEDEDSFFKRKAYFNRLLRYRFGVNGKRLEGMLKKAIPLDANEKERIDDIWASYLPVTLRDELIDYRYYECYKGLKSEEDDLFKYMPDSFYRTFIDDYFTNPQDSRPCDNKNIYDLYFHDISRPKTLFRKIRSLYLDANYSEIPLKEVLRIAKDQPEIICKKASYTAGGMDILIWNSSKDDETKLMEFLKSTEFVICQEMLRQHSELSRLNPTSVNTLRIYTLLFQGEVHVLSSIVRMGVNGSRLDNASQGGLVCGIKPNGQLKDVAWNVFGDRYEIHPGGAVFSSITIPNYQDCINLVRSLAKRMSAISRLISWDLAINDEGYPVLIECNLSFTGTESLQIPNGPLLGDVTADVLKEVFSNSYTLNSIIKSFR